MDGERAGWCRKELGHVVLLSKDGADAVRHVRIGEVEAEAFSLMVAAAHGVDTTSYTVPYVSGWTSSVRGSRPAEVVQATGERVRKAVESVLDRLETVQVSNGDPPGLDRDALRVASRPTGSRQTPTDAGRPTRPARPGPSTPPVGELGL